MSFDISVGDTVYYHFLVTRQDGVTPYTGLVDGDFEKSFYKDNSSAILSSSITEIGLGIYYITFIPDSEGSWFVKIYLSNTGDYFGEYYHVYSEYVDFRSSMADDGTTAVFLLWIEKKGQRSTDITSMTATIMDSDDNIVESLGTNSSPTSDGIFKFTMNSNDLPSLDAYVIVVSATDGTDTWYDNIGFSKRAN